jgi:hypothetical protein
MDTSEKLLILHYTALWLHTGILTEDVLTDQVVLFNTGEDLNTEHYRYKAFMNYIDKQSQLDNAALDNIIEILKTDGDKAMASAAAIDLLKKNYLKNDQFEKLGDFMKANFFWTLKHIDSIQLSRNASAAEK